jgi:FAD:protein FMN transferase
MKSESSLLSIARRHMATDFELEVVVDEVSLRIAESVLGEAHDKLDELESALSEFREDSPVYQVNRSIVGEWIPANSFLIELLKLSRVFHKTTEGAFTPFSRSPFAANFEDLEVDEAQVRIRRLKAELHLGFGAIGKGYALDQVAALLDRQGFTDYRLGAGGSSWVFRGFSAAGAPWEVSWAWAKDEDGDLIGQRYRLPGGKAVAIGVSGTQEQGRHFLKEGEAIEVSIQSAFCSGRSAAEADALSTGLFVGASTQGEEFLTKLPKKGIHDLCFAYVDLENQMVYNQTFDTLFLREGRI